MLVMDAITEILKREGISTLFSFPTTPIIEAAVAGGMRPVICRQERVGVHMADGCARVTNGNPPGVFAMQYGPGAENAFAGIASAYSDSTPILLLPLGLPAAEPFAFQLVDLLAGAARSGLFADALLRRLDQLRQHQLGVAEDRDRGLVGLVEVARIVRRMNDRLPRRNDRGRDVVPGQGRADRKNHIRLEQEMPPVPGIDDAS